MPHADEEHQNGSFGGCGSILRPAYEDSGNYMPQLMRELPAGASS